MSERRAPEVPDEVWFDPVLGARMHTGVPAVEACYTVGERTGPVAMDIETPGLDDALTLNCVTAAWHGADGRVVSVLLDPQRRPDHADAVRVLTARAPATVWHGGAFDMPGMVQAGLMDRAAVRRVWDTLVAARMAYPDPYEPKSLAALSARLLGWEDFDGGMALAFKAAGYKRQDIGYARMDISAPIYRMGAMADTVATLLLVPLLSDAVADRLTDHPFQTVGITDRAGALARLEREQRVNRIMAWRGARGVHIDIDYLHTYRDSVAADVDAARVALVQAGIRPGVGADLVERLERDGVLPGDWPRTATGKLSSAKGHLAAIEHPLASAHRTVAETDKVLNYLDAVASRADGTGRIHPQCGVLAASATGRMCVPESHDLLTEGGRVPVEKVRPGMRTLDREGDWVAVTAVHRYQDQPVDVWTSRRGGVMLECTPEHRWVTRSERGRVEVEPLGHRKRVSVVLTPESPCFDFHERAFNTSTERERFAALVGLLVSDGRCAETDEGMRAYVYQTEGGFYRQMRGVLDALPGALMYDRVTGATGRGPHHEMRVKMRWLRPRLKEAGLRVTDTLNRSDTLPAWAAGLTSGEAREFFRAVWLSDGITSDPDQTRISVDSPQLTEALRVAAYRLGLRLTVHTSPASEWGTKPRTFVVACRSNPSTRNMDKTAGSRTDVWCVTTETGTFTAWSPHMGPYLTGNSYASPALQQFSADARAIIAADPDKAGLTSVDWCLHGDTGVETPYDGVIPIRDIRPGQTVWSWRGGRIVIGTVTRHDRMRPRACMKVTLDNGESFIASPNHKMLRRTGEKVRVDALRPGDSLAAFRRSTDPHGYEVVSVEPAGVHDLWDMTVEGEHNYALACGVISSNSQIEPVTLANMAGDVGFLEPFEAGADLYEPIQRAAGIDRKTAKVVLLATMYGQGEAKLADTIRSTRDGAQQIKRQMLSAMPRTSAFMGQITQVAEATGVAVTVSGRILPVPVFNGQIAAYKAVNYTIQGSAYDVLSDTLVRLDDAGLSDAVHLAMHDELVVDTDVDEAVQAVMNTPPEELVARSGRTPVLRTDLERMGKSWRKV